MQLGYLLAAILKSDAEIAMAMFMSIKSEPGRKAAMLAAASMCIPQWQVQRFEQLLDRVFRTGAQRDRVIHGLWAVSENHPDALILLDQRTMIRTYASNIAHMADLDGPG